MLPLIMAGVGVGTNLIGGWMNRRAQKRAVAKQAESADKANQFVWDGTNNANAGIVDSSNAATNMVLDAGNSAGVGVLNAGQAAQTGMTTAVTDANAGMKTVLEQDGTALNPYINSGHKSLGTLDEVLSPGGRYTSMMDEKFKFDPASDPSYQFVLEQGMKAIQKSAAARGGLQGGGTMQSLGKFAAGHASMEYGKQFDRFQTDRNNRGTLLNNMSSHLNEVAGMGLDAATVKGRNALTGTQWMGDNLVDGAQYNGNVGMQAEQYAGDKRFDAAQYGGNMKYNSSLQTGNNLIDASIYQGNNTTDVGNAQAASDINGTQSLWNGVNGAVNAGGKYLLGSELRPRGNPVPSSAYLPGGDLAPKRHSW